jgi:hypothetical protein
LGGDRDDIQIPLIFDPKFQIAFVSSDRDRCQAFGTLVLQEAG